MNRIKKVFAGKKTLIGFLTGGDPCIQKSEEYIDRMIEAGCDMVEIGLPFSDPIAEGVAIQEADLRALAAYTTTDDIFLLASRVREKYAETPLVVMTYLNPVFKYGYEAFFENCKKSGIDGVIIPDLPYEEKGELTDIADKNDIAVISMMVAVPKERVRMITKGADKKGFLYIMPAAGTDGMSEAGLKAMAEAVEAARKESTLPVAVDLSIHTPEQVKEAAALADGVILDFAVVHLIAEYGENAGDAIYDYIKSVKAVIS